ncbi:restriction endonuclease subunit S [Bacillus glycinifermentans]|uniref:restriction endonuclease subunit S n=1 Tax=Bacillus glycinifermentans TaxID=1664069 RepID=UPI001FF130F4|nr:restriction endonuclease subunit S [Bacillus glycinifermentans]UOY88118.1 restriction endonuclease subunit S [Bacillus glycinifermentans]
MENKHIPEIRFSEFTGNWEQRKLGDITESYSGGTPSVGNKLYYGGTIPFIRSAEINSESTELFITEDGFNNSSAKMVKEGDILYALYGATSGEVGISKIHGAINQAILAIKPKFGDDSYFITQWLKKQKSTIINTYLQGGQGNLSGSIVKDLIISLPTYKDEQVKIGEFFKQLDEMIALHQQELTTLKQTKQGFLQKMFPKEGESVPEVRFPGFTEEWEECKLGDLSCIRRGASPRPIQDPKWFDDESDVGWLRISDVTEQNGLIHHVEQHISEEGQKKTLVLNEPHLILSIAATVGKPVINYIKTGIHDGFIVFINPNFNIDFMFHWLEMFRPKWQKYGQPGSQVNINSELVREQDVFLPSLEEQEKISEFFKRFDDTIALHQRELDALKETKKAFLQKMFV